MFKEDMENKHKFEEIVKDIERVIFNLSKKQIAHILRYNLHPHYLETLAITVLMSIADFNGYYPLQVNEIAKDYKHDLSWREY